MNPNTMNESSSGLPGIFFSLCVNYVLRASTSDIPIFTCGYMISLFAYIYIYILYAIYHHIYKKGYRKSKSEVHRNSEFRIRNSNYKITNFLKYKRITNFLKYKSDNNRTNYNRLMSLVHGCKCQFYIECCINTKIQFVIIKYGIR